MQNTNINIFIINFLNNFFNDLEIQIIIYNFLFFIKKKNKNLSKGVKTLWVDVFLELLFYQIKNVEDIL